MTDIGASASSPSLPRNADRARHVAWTWLAAWPLRRTLVALMGVIGIAILLFPSTMNWFQDRRHASVISGYAGTVSHQSPAQIQAELAAARVYNASLPEGPPRDPYAEGAGGSQTAVGVGAPEYFKLLNPANDGVMGALEIPEIGVSLPIYHGTGASALEKGVGHLFGSALPVGGVGTHAVLTGHSGVVGHELLSHLTDLKLGDTFTVTVLDQVLTYQVDQIRTVLPTQIDALRSVPGSDFLTLLTCTPIGVNSHRLLVRGRRIPTPTSMTSDRTLRATRHAGFPWWAVGLTGGVLAFTMITAPIASRRRR